MTRAATYQPYGRLPVGYRAVQTPALARSYSKLAEWYLVGCIILIVAEGRFTSWLMIHLVARDFFLFRLTPYNLYPTALFNYTIGVIVGVTGYLIGRSRSKIPVPGLWCWLGLWGVALIWGVYGVVSGTMAWLEDFRGPVLPSIVVLWLSTMGRLVRLHIVFNRVIAIAALFAITNAVAGVAHFATGGLSEEFLFAINWRGDYCIDAVYCLALARGLATRRKSAIILSVFILGAIAPLQKPALAFFLVCTFTVVSLGVLTGRQRRIVRIGNMLILGVLLVMIIPLAAKIAVSAGRGAGAEYVTDRYLKLDRSANNRDVSGGRFEMWMESLDRWKHHPVVGVGLGDKLITNTRNGPMPLPIHNMYIQILMQTGIVGAGIIAACGLIWLFRALRSLAMESDPNRYWPRLGMLGFIVSLLAGVSYGDALHVRCISFMFWSYVGLETAMHSQVLAGVGGASATYQTSARDRS